MEKYLAAAAPQFIKDYPIISLKCTYHFSLSGMDAEDKFCNRQL